MRWAALIGLLLAAACADPAHWTPRGEVHWLQWLELERDGQRLAQAVFSVTNTGSVPIEGMDLALVVTTSTQVYYRQYQADQGLAPGKTSFHSLELVFRTLEERGSLGGLRVESATFR